MTWVPQGVISGIERDDDIANHTAWVSSVSQASVAYTALGPLSDRCMNIPLNTSGAQAISAFASGILGTTFNTATMAIFTLDVGGGATTSDAGIISDAGRSSARFIRLHNSPRTLGVYDAGGTLRAVSSSTWSTSALTRFYVLIDCTISTNVLIAVWNKYGVLEAMTYTGISRATFSSGAGNALTLGEYMGVGVTRGASLYGGAILETSVTVADNPLYTPYPVLNVAGGGNLPPTALGSFDEWNGTMTPDTGANKWKNLGATRDLGSPGAHPGHDSDTSFCGVAGVGSDYGKRTTFTYSATNPITSSMTPRFVEMGATRRASGAAKVVMNGMLYDGTNILILPYVQGGTSYAGVKAVTATNPAGAAWAYTDFDLSGGVSVLQFGGRGLTSAESGGANIGGRVTDIPGPVIVYSNKGAFLKTLNAQPIYLT